MTENERLSNHPGTTLCQIGPARYEAAANVRGHLLPRSDRHFLRCPAGMLSINRTLWLLNRRQFGRKQGAEGRSMGQLSSL